METVSNPKVMIIEDNEIVALELKTKLETWGFDVPASACYGEEAIEIAENNDIDLILSDIMIKGDMDGVETIQRISESTNAPPVLYLTASTDNETLKRAKVTKSIGVIYKPYCDEDLMFNIRLALHKIAK